jgi:hypothetical protein
MKQTAVEWLNREIRLNSKIKENSKGAISFTLWLSKFDELFKQAKEMEKKKKLKHQLFIGKVSDIIGFDKTLELLKECNNTIK